MTEKQIDAAFASKRNLFITGAAGTGKTYRLNQYIEEASKDGTVLMCAPTGIAALNLGGDTAHKLFHIPVPAYESPSFAKGKKGALTESMLKPLVQSDVIVIDEISMFKNSDFSFAIKVLRKAERLKGSKIRVIVSGDYSQLPPVVKKADEKIMKKFGFDISGYAFTTQEWKSLNFKVVEMTDVKRQSDIEFVTELNKVRVGDFSTYDYFNQFVNESPDYENAICICGTNAEAERINNSYLDELPGIERAFRAVKTGYVPAGCADEVLVLKAGSRVIFTSNDNVKGRYKNGSFGIVKEFGDGFIKVAVQDGDREHWIDVRPQTVKMHQYSVAKGALQKKEIGSVTQYPLRIGKAITIHKSQGQTFNNVIISPTIFAAGQLYVALSRVRSPQGLALLGEIGPSDFMIDEVVQKFYKNGYTFEVAKKKSVSSTVKSGKTASTKKTATKSGATTKRKSVSGMSKSGSGASKTKKAAKSTTTKKTIAKKVNTASSKRKTTTKK